MPRSRVKRAVPSLFNLKEERKPKVRLDGSIRSFVAYRDQCCNPTIDFDKDELYEAGLGMKEIEFDSVNMSAEEFREVIFQVLQCLSS